ncbi:alpha/beta hydrolase [Variovorax sp. PBL-E5]|uniref:alpha/beta hydrolase n=1 Tax=Variovorax sp. PBL-E5 TaxID=434014 RepID=UPI001315F7A8|nr:alpha/beta hydrolase family protein [Variovorax sp. PBL-E5]VTU38610.1 putative magnesium chelatase accessory protein [Variovorax sp. PBL-E5]
MQRRSFLGAGAVGILTDCAGGAIDAQSRPVIILVHGAWHGAWCWERVTPLLGRAGYRSVAVSLPGMGERKSELSLSINLDSHIDTVVEAALAPGQPAALVGHSYAGFVITGAAARLASSGRLRSLVYLDAFVPADGEQVSDYMPADARAKLAATLAAGNPAYGAVPARFFGIEKPEDIDWAQARLTAQPAATYFQPLHLAAALPPATRRSYIACQSPRLPVFDATKARIRGTASWTYRELQTGHDAMVTAPQDLSLLIAELA